MSLEFQAISNGCQKYFLEWNVARRSVCRAAQGFVDPHRPDDVYKLKRALYGLKQAPQTWFDRLTSYLIGNGFKRGNANTTLFIRKDKNHFFVAQVYVDIIFGSTNDFLAKSFADEMKKMFEMRHGR